MARITNLTTFRKQKAREAARKAGDENAARFGRTAAQKALETTRARKERDHLDGHKRDDDPRKS